MHRIQESVTLPALKACLSNPDGCLLEYGEAIFNHYKQVGNQLFRESALYQKAVSLFLVQVLSCIRQTGIMVVTFDMGVESARNVLLSVLSATVLTDVRARTFPVLWYLLIRLMCSAFTEVRSSAHTERCIHAVRHLGVAVSIAWENYDYRKVYQVMANFCKDNSQRPRCPGLRMLLQKVKFNAKSPPGSFALKRHPSICFPDMSNAKALVDIVNRPTLSPPQAEDNLLIFPFDDIDDELLA